ncbi:MAG: response regulator [Pseudomonadota bacterium]
MRILSVDDKDENRYLVEVLLIGNGYEVESVANGAEAMASLRENRFDLIISDILMPVMDGFELCRKVKTDPQLQHIPLIFYTATYTGAQDEAFAIKIGADRFLVKPCEIDIFMATIREVLAASQEKPRASVPEPPDDEEVFKLYNERLVRKLEQKMLQLEKETTALRQAENALRISEGKYRRLHESMTDGFIYVDMEGNIQESNESFRNMLGYKAEELGHLTYRDLTPEKWHDLERDIIENQVLVQGFSQVYEKEYLRKDGQVFPVELKTFLVRDDAGDKEGMWAIVRDMTERKRTEKKQKELEEQLYQAQKMESIGRLAGGVAHDYNNMLSVILGNAQMALIGTQPDSKLYGNLQDILDAANRSANITRQLLAFARKQAVVPQVVALNAAVASMLRMLERLIGEDVELTWLPGQDLWPVRIDISQVDQILANLCVNARDAISSGGRILIETANTFLDAEYCARHAGISTGEFVLLTISDNGFGMEPTMLDKIFEPFFTTKALGQGTGLGLATVYGIVKQNNGLIDVYSEPGTGTVFKIFLPRHTGKTTEEVEQRIVCLERGQGEMVLIVEDEAAILRLTGKIMEEAGYKVQRAGSPSEAIRLARELEKPLDLLIADMVMPEMNGRDLKRILLSLHPEMKSIFMSGYTASFITGQGILAEGINFIHKPFSAEDLTIKAREVLTGFVRPA